MDLISLFVKICINYAKEIISMKPLKSTVLYTATMKGGKQLLRQEFSQIRCKKKNLIHKVRDPKN